MMNTDPTPTHPRRGRRFASRLAAAAAVLLSVAAIAAPTATAAPEGIGWARFGHFAPSADAVDITVDGELFAENVGFKSVSAYRELSAGVHEFQLRPVGQPDVDPVLSVQASVPAAAAITVGAVTSRDGVSPQVFDDELATLDPGQSLVRFIHAAPDAAAVDITAIGTETFAAGVPYPEATGYMPIEPGQYQVSISDSDTGDVVLEIDGWSIQAGEQSTIVVVQGTDGKLDVAPVVDAVAVAVAPAGGVQTGFGGMSDVLDPQGRGTNFAPWAIGASGLVALAAVVVIHRRRSRDALA